MLILHVTLDTLGAEFSLVEWKIFPRLKADHLVVSNAELDAALLSAEATVGLHQFLVLTGMFPTSRRYTIQGWAELADDRWNVYRELRHLQISSLSERLPQTILGECN